MLEADKLFQKAAQLAISARHKAKLAVAHLYVQHYLDPALVHETKALLRRHIDIRHWFQRDFLDLIVAEIAAKKLSKEEAILNAHYWAQTLPRPNVGPQVLCAWRPQTEQFIDSNHGRFWFAGLPLDAIKYYQGKLKDFNEFLSGIRNTRAFERFLKLTVRQEPILIVSNHSGWQNLPFLATVLHGLIGCSLNRMTTVIGPAVANLYIARSVANITNLIVTIPPSPHGRLPNELDNIQNQITKNALDRMTSLPEKSHLPPILIMCPFGTTDKETCEQITLSNARSAHAIIRALARKGGYSIVPVATHDAGALAGTRISNSSDDIKVQFCNPIEPARNNKKIGEDATNSLAAALQDISGKKVLLQQ